MKLVNECRLSAAESQAVQPRFDMAAAEQDLKDHRGYGRPVGGTLENEAYFADEIAEKVRENEGVRKSERDVTRDYDYYKPWSEQVDDFRSGEEHDGNMYRICSTPKVYRDIGFARLPFVIGARHLGYMLNGTYLSESDSLGDVRKRKNHEFSEENVKQLPDLS